MHTPKLEPSPSAKPENNRRKSLARRSPSPPSPRSSNAPSASKTSRRQPLDPASRRISLSKTRSTGNLRESTAPPPSFSSSASHSLLARDTDAVCRALRIFRRKLANSTENLSPEMVRELERELSATMRTLGEKVMQGHRRRRELQKERGKNHVDEEVLGRVLDQYSERLVEMLDMKLAGLSLGGGGGGNVERDGHREKGKQAVAGAEVEPGGGEPPGGEELPRTGSFTESIEEHEDEGKEQDEQPP